MISDAMKRNIPSVRASTRELWCATGGWAAWSKVAMSADWLRCLGLLAGDLDVRDGQAGLLAQPVDEVAAQPARGLLAREGRDDDLVDALVLRRVHRSRERVRVRDLAVDVDSLAAQDRQRPPQPPLGLGMRCRVEVGLRRDDQEGDASLRRALADGL